MDIISQLSEDLLIRILSLVPRSHVPATSLLSKRWQFLWTLMPELEFDDRSHHHHSDNEDDDNKSFTQFVYRSLLSNKAPVLDSLHLKLGPKCQAVDIGTWISIAIARHVRTVRIDMYEKKSISIRLPNSLYTCETLESLTLLHYIRLDIPFSVCLPSLKILFLEDVDYADKESLPRLLSGCPKLEQLFLKQDKLDVALVLPSLKTLTMRNDGLRDEKGSSGFVIEAPFLKYLRIEDDVIYDFHRIENMPKLEVATVDITHGVMNHKFLKAFTTARSLYLCLSFLEVLSPSGMIFHNLVDLTLNTCAEGWWDLLTHMLQDSPKLGFLKLDDEHELFPSKEAPDCWKPPSFVSECLLSSFEAFEWNGYKGRRGDRKMATYLLANATCLKTAIFSPESKDVEARYQMIQDLACVATPSSWFQLFFD